MHKTLYFKGFNRIFGRARKSATRTLKERFDEIRGRAPGQLHSLFSEAVEAEKIGRCQRLPRAALSGRCDRLGHARTDVSRWHSARCGARNTGRGLRGRWGAGPRQQNRQLTAMRASACHRTVWMRYMGGSVRRSMSSGGLLGGSARHGRGRHFGATGRLPSQSRGVLPTRRAETRLRVPVMQYSGSVQSGHTVHWMRFS